MTMRKIAEIVGKRNGRYFAGIWYDSEFDEYRVRTYDAHESEVGDYATSDRDDAFNTAQHWADNGPA